MTELRALRLSLTATLVFATLGLVFGLITGSTAILFDGVFSIIDAAVSSISLLVAGLIARSHAAVPWGTEPRRFSMGYCHLEPMVLLLSSMMMSVTAYALVSSVLALLHGGRDVEFRPGIVYAAMVLVMTSGVVLVEHRANRHLRSALVATDIKRWIMTGGVTAALLTAFIVGSALRAAGRDDLVPCVDPAVLAVVATVLLPVPVRTLLSSGRELLLIAAAPGPSRGARVSRSPGAPRAPRAPSARSSRAPESSREIAVRSGIERRFRT
ncbi:cation transporter [Brachybacterium huguangmaarense]